jgi:hypothetical protein
MVQQYGGMVVGLGIYIITGIDIMDRKAIMVIGGYTTQELNDNRQSKS